MWSSPADVDAGFSQDWDGTGLADQFRSLRVAMPTPEERAAAVREQLSRSVRAHGRRLPHTLSLVYLCLKTRPVPRVR